MNKTVTKQKASPPASLLKCPTGIQGPDEITCGGLPQGRISFWKHLEVESRMLANANNGTREPQDCSLYADNNIATLDEPFVVLDKTVRESECPNVRMSECPNVRMSALSTPPFTGTSASSAK